ncbi:MAG: hypothetical protein WBP13_11255 [Methylophilaceae bacterium]
MDKKRLIFGAFWAFNIFIGVFALYVAITVQLSVYTNTAGQDAHSVAGAFQDGYTLGLALQKQAAIYFLKEHALKVALVALIISAIGSSLGWLPGTKPSKNAENETQNTPE